MAKKGLATTLAIGEEGPPDTPDSPLDPIEGGGKWTLPPEPEPIYPGWGRPGKPKKPGDGDDGWATTLACGEEGNDCGIDEPDFTTMALGEEGDGYEFDL